MPALQMADNKLRNIGEIGDKKNLADGPGSDSNFYGPVLALIEVFGTSPDPEQLQDWVL
jgi:hypothetical protein